MRSRGASRSAGLVALLVVILSFSLGHPPSSEASSPVTKIFAAASDQDKAGQARDLIRGHNLGNAIIEKSARRPLASELYFGKGHEDLGGRIASLLGLKAAYSADLTKTHIMIFLAGDVPLRKSRIAVYPSPEKRDEAVKVVRLIRGENLGEVKVKDKRSPPTTSDISYHPDHAQTAARLSEILGLSAHATDDMRSSDVAVFLGPDFVLGDPAASPSKKGETSSGWSLPDFEWRMPAILSAGTFETDLLFTLEPFQSHAIKETKGEASSAVGAPGIGGALSLFLGGNRLSAGLFASYARLASRRSGFGSEAFFGAGARGVLIREPVTLYVEMRLGSSWLEPFDGKRALGLGGAGDLGFRIPLGFMPRLHLAASAGYRASFYAPSGFDWFVIHGTELRTGMHVRF